jgi:hypothetical protein
MWHLSPSSPAVSATARLTPTWPAGASPPVYYRDPVSSGDVTIATVTRNCVRYTFTLSNQTRGWSKTATEPLPASNLSAEVAMESPTASYPNLGTVSSSGATADGQLLPAYHQVALDASNAAGDQDHTGLLSGGSFSITYLGG